MHSIVTNPACRVVHHDHDTRSGGPPFSFFGDCCLDLGRTWQALGNALEWGAGKLMDHQLFRPYDEMSSSTLTAYCTPPP
jgi:hypothetical protein